MKKENINPKDIETWNTKSSSHTGGGGSGENNGSNPGGNGSGNNNGGSNGPVEPDPNWGGGAGLSLDKPAVKE